MDNREEILIYDREGLLKGLLEEFSPIFNFSYVIKQDIAQVQQFISAKKSHILLIVEKEDFKTLLPLLELKEKCSVQLVFFAKTSTDALSFRKLKEELGVDYVLQQPIDKNEFAALFRKIFSKEGSNEPGREYLTPELLNKYNEKIFEKIERIEELINSTEKATDYKANLLELRNEIHKITGNAAPYGYVDAGKLCASHEVFLYNLYSESINRELSEIMFQNELFLRKLKLCFQKVIPKQTRAAYQLFPDQSFESNHKGEGTKKDFLIHLITSDFDLARYFQSAAEKKHLHLEIEDNPESYLANYRALQIQPAIILVDETFPFTKWSGMDLIKQLAAISPKKLSLYGLMTDWDDLDKRLEWMDLGIDLIVKKPITEASVDYVLSNALRKKISKAARVLIVDDDEEQGLLMKTILESINITTLFLQDPSKLFEHLEDFTPDLLLLDVNMPKYTGKFLLSALRDDIRYKNLIIVIETALSSNDVEDWAYQAQCDAIIYKPLNIPIFLARISSLLERQREHIAPKELDSLTGLLRWESFLLRVEEFLFQSPKETKCAFMLLKIEKWENLISVITPSEMQQILLLFSELMKSHFFSSLFQGVFAEGAYAFLFKELSGGELEFLLESFYQKIYSKIWLSSKTALKIHANASVVLFVSGDAELSKIFDAGQKALDVAENMGSSKTEIRRIGEKIGQPLSKKQVILIDDDLDLCDIICFAFEQHGFSVQNFHNAKDALHYFAQLPALEHNSLIILDRRLPDGDGLDILHKIQDKFPGNIKAIFLSSLSNEREILEGLRSGALDYMTKPFSIEVLIEKASILLSK